MRLPEGVGGRGGRLPNQPLQSPSNRAVWSGTGERGKERERKAERKRIGGIEKRRGRLKKCHIWKKPWLAGSQKKERETDRVLEGEMLIAAADNSQRFFKMMRG